MDEFAEGFFGFPRKNYPVAGLFLKIVGGDLAFGFGVEGGGFDLTGALFLKVALGELELLAGVGASSTSNVFLPVSLEVEGLF